MRTPIFVPDEHVSEQDYLAYLANHEAESIHGAGHWFHSIIRRAAGVEDVPGDRLPWSKTHDDFQMRPNEVTIWAGYRGHMKSFATGMVAAWLARDVRVGIASFEMPPTDTLWRMICQCSGVRSPSPEYAQLWLEAMDSMIRVYDQTVTLTPQKVLAVIHHMAHNLGCGHIVIDSLMKCGIPTDDYTGQKNFVEQLTLAAKRYGVHIHLVAHLRKPHQKTGLPNSDDVAGGSDITNLADNVVIVWNDKHVMELLAKRRDGFPLDVQELEEVEQRTHILKLDKHRRGPDQLLWKFWFHPSGQFLPENRGEAMPWVHYDTTLERMAAINKLSEVA